MGKIINNNYELLEQLGQGGMGVIYKARHIHFKEIVAIKRLCDTIQQRPHGVGTLSKRRQDSQKTPPQKHCGGFREFEGSHYMRNGI
jgi:serine/threonine protein kinase